MEGLYRDRLQQMVDFIKQEANEKAREIYVSGEEEFVILKQEILEVGKRKIKQEYEKKEKHVELRKKIEYSMQLNNSRIRVLQAQDDLVQSIKEAAKKKIYALSTNHRVYRHLIRDLVVQGLIMLKEPYVVLQCRHVDVELVKTVLQLAKDKYAAKMKSHPPDVVIDDKFFLAADGDCAGGVISTSKDGRIICDNTLDSRLEVTFRQILPEIRRRLLGNGMSVNRADT